EVALLEADVDEGAVPKAALGDRDLQGLGSGGIPRHNCNQADNQNKNLTHLLPPQIPLNNGTTRAFNALQSSSIIFSRATRPQRASSSLKNLPNSALDVGAGVAPD